MPDAQSVAVRGADFVPRPKVESQALPQACQGLPNRNLTVFVPGCARSLAATGKVWIDPIAVFSYFSSSYYGNCYIAYYLMGSNTQTYPDICYAWRAGQLVWYQ